MGCCANDDDDDEHQKTEHKTTECTHVLKNDFFRIMLLMLILMRFTIASQWNLSRPGVGLMTVSARVYNVCL